MANKLQSLLLSLCVTLLISTDYFYFTHLAEAATREKIVIKRVIDGDTLVLSDNRTNRLLNINAPEKSSVLASNSYAYLKKFEGKEVEIEVTTNDKYNRSLVKVYAPEYINLEMTKQGLVSKFLVQKNELKSFDLAEKEAIEKERGIWRKSKYYGCFRITINPKAENVTIRNTCNPINLEGWLMKDESRKTFTFPKIESGTININSFSGKPNSPFSRNLFWNSSTSVWNDDRDTLYLFDERNRLAAHYSYGY